MRRTRLLLMLALLSPAGLSLAWAGGRGPGTKQVADLMPWHYHDPFFQESPAVFDADLDAPYRKADILELCRKFYAGVGLPIVGALL